MRHIQNQHDSKKKLVGVERGSEIDAPGPPQHRRRFWQKQDLLWGRQGLAKPQQPGEALCFLLPHDGLHQPL